MSTTPDISIVIVSYNVRDLLVHCLESIYLYSGTKPGPEIIVVDNHSSDGSCEAIASAFPEVKLIRNNYNAGFSRANNQGMDSASGKYYFMLNPDTEFESDVLEVLRKQFLSDDHRILAPKLVNSDGSLQVSCHKFPGLFSVIAETLYLHRVLHAYEYPLPQFQNQFQPDWASGAALFFSRELYRKTGPLDNNLFWMDDVDFCYRASRNGYKVTYVPETHIVHHSGKSSEKNIPVTLSNQLLSKVKYFAKHRGSFYPAVALIFILIHILTRTIVFLALSPVSSEFRKKFAAYLYSLKKYFNYIFNSDRGIS